MDLIRDHVEPGKTSRRLLGGWRDILDDIQKLDVSLHKLPEHCSCGPGGGLPRGTCACCREGTSARGCVDCEALLAQIGDRVDGLRADELRFTGVLRDFTVRRPDHEEMRRGLDDVTIHTSRLVRIVEGVGVAAAELRQGCRVGQLARLKALVHELREEGERLDKEW